MARAWHGSTKGAVTLKQALASVLMSAAASRLRALLKPRAPEFAKGSRYSSWAVELSETHALEFLLLLLELGLPLRMHRAMISSQHEPILCCRMPS